MADSEVPSALLYTTTTTNDDGGDDGDAGDAGEEQALATEVKPGETYTLLLDNFPPAQLLALRLTGDGAAAPSRLLGLVPSSSSSFSSKASGGGDNDGVRWRWRVGDGTPPGEYFIEVASQRQDAFAYSNAFRVVSG